MSFSNRNLRETALILAVLAIVTGILATAGLEVAAHLIDLDLIGGAS